MAVEDLAGQAGEPDQPQPTPVLQEIRTRMAKLDRVDEIVGAVNSMRDVVGLLTPALTFTAAEMNPEYRPG